MAKTATKTATKPDVVDLLIEQHAQIRDLFGEVLMSEPDRRAELFARLVTLLAVHETAEEEIIHPLARRSLPGGADVVEDRLAEERHAKELLASLEDMDVEDPKFLLLLDELRLAVLTHARSEERYEFADLRESFTDLQHRGLVAAVQAAEATAPTHPHPGTESAAKNLLVGPAAAVVDRVRDAIRSVK
jgi:hemerythrin superfamily protein